MPFTGAVFANVSGASNAAAGQIVQSAVWNNIHVDYSDAFTQVMEQLIAQITNRNILWMNGGFEVWQRGAGSTSVIAVAASTTAYTSDRWYIRTLTNQVATVFAETGLSTSSQLSARVRRDAAQTGTGVMVFGYPLDTDEVIRMRGKVMTLSMLLVAGANWSPANGTLVATLYMGTGAVSKRGAGFSGEVTSLTVSTNLTPSAAAVAVSATSSGSIIANATCGELQFTWTPVGTAGANDYFAIDDVQLECNLSSDTWTPNNFDRLSYPVMLTGCKRHYNKTFPYEIAPVAGSNIIANSLTISSQAIATMGLWWQYPVEMRANPTFTKYHVVTATSSNWYNITVGTSVSASFVTVSANNTKGVLITGVTVSADVNYVIQAQADAGI